MPDIDPAASSRLLSPVVESGEGAAAAPVDGAGLCMSGGGYRAMLFHVGTLWRLNEMQWLPKLTRISSVSGGSITAAVLGMNWGRLNFNNGVAAAFGPQVVDPVRRMASTSIDVSSVLSGIFHPFDTVADRVAKQYAKVLFDRATLQDLPDSPEFILCATNVQTGSLVRFSKRRIADWQVGEVSVPTTALASAVGASSAFPPVLSPAELAIAPGEMHTLPGALFNHPPFNTSMVLTDGGVYDNLGIEQVWKRCATVLVSDAGQKISPEPAPAHDYVRHLVRVLDIVDNQVRSLRKRQVIDSFESKARNGSYWGIRTDIANYATAGALNCPIAKTRTLAAVPTRLTAVDEPLQQKLINWGYAVCDAAMRKHVDPNSQVAAQFPYPIGVG